MSAEQWLENGDCKQCRRAKYCSKVCKAHSFEKYLSELLNKMFQKLSVYADFKHFHIK